MIAFEDPFRMKVVHLFAGGLAVGLGVTALASADDGPTLCLFRRCTGGFCPGCGASRSAGALVRGDLAGAWQHHPWVVLAVGQMVVLSVLALSGIRVRRERLLPPLLVVNAAAGLLIWCVRLAAGMIPVPFG